MLAYKTKIFIDRTFGLATVIAVRVLTRLAGLILNRKHDLPPNPEVIAVAKYIGMGSILYTGILCRAVKNRFPRAKLIYITSKTSLQFVERIKYIDQVLYIDDQSAIRMIFGTIRLIFKLWKVRPVLYFDMEVYSSWAAIIATLSLALNRYGFYRHSSNFKRGMHSHMIFFNTNTHISRIYAQMALCIGAKADTSPQGLLKISTEDRRLCNSALAAAHVDKPVILVNVNASELLTERRWPLQKWAAFLEEAAQTWPGYMFILTGSKGEAEYVATLYEMLSEQCRRNVLNLAGRFPLGAFLALVEKAQMLVTNDTGPFHFAVSLGTPTISIWGPCTPKHYGPTAGTNKVIYEPVYCSPCVHQADFPPCQGNNICVNAIEVDKVITATGQLLDRIKTTIPAKSVLADQGTAGSSASPAGITENFNPVITHRKQISTKKQKAPEYA